MWDLAVWSDLAEGNLSSGGICSLGICPIQGVVNGALLLGLGVFLGFFSSRNGDFRGFFLGTWTGFCCWE
jgi:hypothetical protein